MVVYMVPKEAKGYSLQARNYLGPKDPLRKYVLYLLCQPALIGSPILVAAMQLFH